MEININFLFADDVHGSLDDMFKLPDIARPGMGVENFHAFRGNPLYSKVKFAVILVHKMAAEEGDIFPALAQGRQVDIDHCQAVIQQSWAGCW